MQSKRVRYDPKTTIFTFGEDNLLKFCFKQNLLNLSRDNVVIPLLKGRTGIENQHVTKMHNKVKTHYHY